MSTLEQQLADLENAKKQNLITEEEYIRERNRILNGFATQNKRANSNKDLGMEENNFLLLLHLSQFSGFLIAGAGFIVPIILWLVNKDKSEQVDKHGKNILNFMISWLVYYVIGFILTVTILLAIVGIPMLILAAILQIVFIIIASIQASNGIYWKYPLTIPFFT